MSTKRHNLLYREACDVLGRVRGNSRAMALFWTKIGVWRLVRASRLQPHEYHDKHFAGVFESHSATDIAILRRIKKLDQRKGAMGWFGHKIN